MLRCRAATTAAGSAGNVARELIGMRGLPDSVSGIWRFTGVARDGRLPQSTDYKRAYNEPTNGVMVAPGILGGEIMLRQALCCFLILTLVGLGRPALAAEQTVQDMKDTAAKAYQEGSKVKVKLKDGIQVRGRISSYSFESFTLDANQRLQTVSYTDVTEIKRQMSLGVKVLIILGACVGAIGILCAATGCGD